jgi:Zn-dependent alcohol dehydrogenase
MGTRARVVVVPGGTNTLQVEDVTLPDPGPRQVVVKQFASGVCHSQLHEMHNTSPRPRMLGHESTGVVLQAGAEVSHVAEGDVVLVTWVPRNPAAAAEPPVQMRVTVSEGEARSLPPCTWGDHTICDGRFVVKVDPDTPRDVTAIIGCAVITGAGAVVTSADVQAGQSVAIFGVGGVGLSAVAGAAAVGADPIIAVDLDDAKLEFARRFGATHTINASQEDAVAAVHALTPGPSETALHPPPFGDPVSGVDFAFDCIGVRQTMEQIVPAVRGGRGGTAVLVGLPTTDMTLSPLPLMWGEKRFIGSRGGSGVPERDIPRFLAWHREGKLDLDSLVTARYRIDEISEATQALEAGRISGRAILEF